MSRFYTLSYWCNKHGIIIHRDGDEKDAGFIFSKNDYDCHFDYADVIERPDVVRDQLRDNFDIGGRNW